MQVLLSLTQGVCKSGPLLGHGNLYCAYKTSDKKRQSILGTLLIYRLCKSVRISLAQVYVPIWRDFLYIVCSHTKLADTDLSATLNLTLPLTRERWEFNFRCTFEVMLTNIQGHSLKSYTQKSGEAYLIYFVVKFTYLSYYLPLPVFWGLYKTYMTSTA